MIWFYLFMAAGGLLYILSGVYEWMWIRKLEQSLFFLRQVSWRTVRVLYLIVGTGGLGVALAGLVSVLTSENSPLLVLTGLTISSIFTALLLNSRTNQTIT